LIKKGFENDGARMLAASVKRFDTPAHRGAIAVAALREPQSPSISHDVVIIGMNDYCRIAVMLRARSSLLRR
jgi:hypothetical protein